MASRSSSDLARVCTQFRVNDTYELHELYMQHDQALVQKGEFDPHDTSQIPNRVKDALECVQLEHLSERDARIVRNLLWLWHHHATTVAIWQWGDLSQAREWCRRACAYQYPEHPNTITRLLYLFLEGHEEEANEWMQQHVAEAEQAYARHILEEYQRGTFTDRP